MQKYTIPLVTSALITRVFFFFAVLCLSGVQVSAQPISSAVGLPGIDPNWNTVCTLHSPKTPEAPGPNATSQLSFCTAGNPDECLHRVTIPNGTFPNATCNDGSPGVFYVRPGTGANANKWIIHTQGGGRCTDYDSCLQRWCGQQGASPYKANKMSTDWNDDGVVNLHLQAEASGIFQYDPGNQLHDWTHVWMYYCSSDSWQGRANNVAYSGSTPFDIDHRGHTILSAARRMLRKNAVPGWQTDDEYSVPDLDNATHVVFTGTSGGATGSIHNVDWFMTPLAAPNKYHILDANMDNLDSVLASRDIWVDEDGDGVGDTPYFDYREQLAITSWDTGYLGAINAFTDETCYSFYEPIGRLDRCSYLSLLLTLNIGGTPIIETETFVRFDLEDGVATKPWQGVWPDGVTQLMVGGQNGRYTTIEDHTQAVRETLVELYDDHDTVTGVFGPRCAQHVGLENTSAYALHMTPHTDITTDPPTAITGTESTAHDAIVQWLNIGGGATIPVLILDTDDVGDPTILNENIDPETKFSICP